MIQKAKKILFTIRRALFYTNEADWYCKFLTKEDCAFAGSEAGLRVEYNNYNETVQWLRVRNKEFPWIYNPKEIESAEKCKHLYPSLKYNEAIIGYVKIAVAAKVYIADYEDDIDLKNDEAFIYDTFILPGFRGKQMGSFILCNIFNKLKTDGISFVFCHIPGWNRDSSKLYQNLGFKKISNVRYLRLFNFRYFSNRPDYVKEDGRKLFTNV